MFEFVKKLFKFSGKDNKRAAIYAKVQREKAEREELEKEKIDLAKKRYTFKLRHLDIARCVGAEKIRCINKWNTVAHNRLKRLMAINSNRKVRGLREYKIVNIYEK